MSEGRYYKMRQEIIAKTEEIINTIAGNWEKSICTLSLIDDQGFPTASTLSTARADGIKWLSFVTGLVSNKAKRIEKCNKACVCFNSADYNITLVGTIEVLTDAQAKKDVWYSGLEHHFTGVDDPNLCVLKFTTNRYQIYGVIGHEEIYGEL